MLYRVDAAGEIRKPNFAKSGFLFRFGQKIGAMTKAAFIGRQGVSRYFFVFEIDQGKRAIACFTVNKHWAPLIFFHGRTPIVSLSAV